MTDLKEFIVSKDAREKLKDPDYVQEKLAEGVTFQEIIGYSNETLDKFYQAARNMLINERAEDASNAFLFLTTINPYLDVLWLGLGMSLHMTKEYQSASQAYILAAMMNEENPVPYYYAANCLFETGEKDAALELIGEAKKVCADKEEHAELKKEIEEREIFLKNQ